jgi:short-chain Z-isoprenyl diphosphate synthase
LGGGRSVTTVPTATLKRASKGVVVARGATYVAGARKELAHLVAMSAFSQQLAYKCILGARSVWHSAIGRRGEGVNEMNPGWSPVHERAATLAVDRQTASARVVTRQESPTERKRPGKSTATSLLLRLLYWIYERRLLDQLKQRPTPRHVGIILDGNRRHARKRGVSDPCEIYQRGAEKLDEILDWCSELRIPAVTLWVFSTENLKRSQAEISGILSAIEAKVAALAHDPFMHQKRVRIQAIGRLDLLPESVVAAIRAAETATAQYNLMTLTIAVGYGGREEISDAVRSFLKTQAREGASLSDAIERITPEAIACHLYASNLPDPDLIIRTSGEIRLSGFLLWQSVHSEFYFTDVLWPAFRKVDFLRAIRAYQARDRRFGR